MRWINLKQEKPTKGKRAKSVRKRPMPRWTRRSLRALGVAAIFALALGGPAWVWQSGWVGNATHSAWQSAATRMGDAGLRVDQILLQGRRHESPDRITRVLNIERGDPLLAVDLKYARERLETLPWIRVVNLARAMEEMAEAGYWRIGLTGHTDTTFAEALPAGPVAIVLGAEGEGMRHNIGTHCDALAKLPISSSGVTTIW